MVALGAHILDVLGRPVEAIPPGQSSTRLTEIRATAAGTAAGLVVGSGAQARLVYSMSRDNMLPFSPPCGRSTPAARPRSWPCWCSASSTWA
ncbi:MAG: hypothetical protein ACRDRJ_35355 [Streptosporangiaceae bacterium]